MRHVYKTRHTCAKEIQFDIDDGVVRNVEFKGGCEGNLKAIPVLLEGMPVDSVVERLKGITCGSRSTSCSDQLAIALQNALEE